MKYKHKIDFSNLRYYGSAIDYINKKLTELNIEYKVITELYPCRHTILFNKKEDLILAKLLVFDTFDESSYLY